MLRRLWPVHCQIWLFLSFPAAIFKQPFTSFLKYWHLQELPLPKQHSQPAPFKPTAPPLSFHQQVHIQIPRAAVSSSISTTTPTRVSNTMLEVWDAGGGYCSWNNIQRYIDWATDCQATDMPPPQCNSLTPQHPTPEGHCGLFQIPSIPFHFRTSHPPPPTAYLTVSFLMCWPGVLVDSADAFVRNSRVCSSWEWSFSPVLKDDGAVAE